MGWCCGENLDSSNSEILLADIEAEKENKGWKTHLIISTAFHQVEFI